tara:strand:- start:2219 stop:2614 length:396 start_codon:yes stop_codon:yes gene_type:complete
MFKLNSWFGSFVLITSVFFFISCEKEAVINNITSNDGVQARLAYTEKGYTEVEVSPIVKITCYFSKWDKDVMTPVSGFFDYYDTDDNWVASIDFGDGTCDEWVTKTWDVNIFPDYPSGTNNFSVFDYKDKK